MKGAKGGKRDRIISFLFSKKNKEEKEKIDDLNQNKYDDNLNRNLKSNILNTNSTQNTLDNNQKTNPTPAGMNENGNSQSAVENEQNTFEPNTYSNNNQQKHNNSTPQIIHDNMEYSEGTIENEQKVQIEDNLNQKTYYDNNQQKHDNSTPQIIHDSSKNTQSTIPTTKDNISNIEQPKTEDQTLDTSEPSKDVEPYKQSTQNISNTVSKTQTSQPDEKEVQISSDEKIVENDDEKLYLEKSVVETLERIIKEDLEELEQIQYELEVLSQKEDQEVLTKEVEELKERLEALISKFEKIKEMYYGELDENALKQIDDEELYTIINDYKENYKDNNLMELVELEIKTLENYVSLIDQLSSVEIQKDELDKKIDDKLDRYQIRDDEFEQMKNDYENIEELKDIIDKFNDEQDRIMKEMEQKIKNSEKIIHETTTTMNLVPHFNRLIGAALLIAASKKIPPTPRGNIIKAVLIVGAIRNAANFITTETKTEEKTKIKYSDFSNDLKSIKDDISGVIYKIDDAFKDVSKIKDKFKKDCEEYASQIPEYAKFMKNLDYIEQELKKKQDIAKKQKDQFDKMLELNNQKVKRLERQENAQLAA